MSAHQGSPACPIMVDPSTADVLRIEAKKVLMFNHEPFEDFLDYVPVKQLELADVYRDATAVIDALGWDPDICLPRASVEVPLTRGHIEQLHCRRADLLDTNLDLLGDIGADRHHNATVMAEIHHKPPRRRSAQPHLRRLQRHHHHIACRPARAGGGEPPPASAEQGRLTTPLTPGGLGRPELGRATSCTTMRIAGGLQKSTARR